MAVKIYPGLLGLVGLKPAGIGSSGVTTLLLSGTATIPITASGAVDAPGLDTSDIKYRFVRDVPDVLSITAVIR